MTSERTLKFINLSIAVLIVALLVGAWWLLWRPLPKTSGTIRLPIGAAATVQRDRLGVPHITAASIEDALFVQGYVTAQDRLWQMDALRRAAAGELAEIAGTPALESDREMRRIGMRRIAEAQESQMRPEERAIVAAYARGVNQFIETHRGRYPLEFTLLGYDPKPWTTVDTLLAGLYMSRELTMTWKFDLQRAEMLASGDPAKVKALFPVWSTHEFIPGSNAWVLSGAHTASGKPILANDPHLVYAEPSPWYMIQLKAPGLNVVGVSLPGVPGVILGHNDRIAWGFTNLGFDVCDLYEERLDPDNGQYVFAGHVEQAQLARDFIRVKGARTEELDTWITRHGPVVAEDGSRYYAMRWTAAEPNSFHFRILALDAARNWTEFKAALAGFAYPAQNIVYADVDGNIGYHVNGILPIRRGFDGSVPVDGSSGQYEWQGFIPFDSLPNAFNPPSGRIVTANQNPFPHNYPWIVHGVFAAHYRANQIRDLLSAREKWTPKQMLTVEKDVYSSFATFLARQVLAAYDRKHPSDPELADAMSVLRGWNGQMEIGEAAPMLMELVSDRLRLALANIAAPGKGALWGTEMGTAVLADVLANGGGGWFADQDEALLHAVSEAIDDGARTQGSRVSHWDYGKWNELTIAQPVASHIPLIGTWFNIGPVPMSGAPESVKQERNQRLGPSMRMIVDFSNLDQSLNNIPTGESEQILSGHYRDQWDAYYYARSFRMEFSRIEAKQELRVLPETGR